MNRNTFVTNDTLCFFVVFAPKIKEKYARNISRKKKRFDFMKQRFMENADFNTNGSVKRYFQYVDHSHVCLCERRQSVSIHTYI